MASNQVLSAVWRELEHLKRVPFAELVAAVESAVGFYGEGDIPLPEREK